MTESEESKTEVMAEIARLRFRINELQSKLNEPDLYRYSEKSTSEPTEPDSAISRDVTQQENAEVALRLAESKFKALVEQLPAIVYSVEYGLEQNRTTYISPQVESLLGFTVEEWLNTPSLWKQQIHPDDREDVLAEVAYHDKIGDALNLEYRVLAKDGRIVWFHNKSKLIREGSTLRYAHGVMFDITIQKQLEAQLRQVQRMEAVGQMASGIAHNFNNVLTSLIGHAELAIDTLEPDHPVRFDVAQISKNAQRAAELIKQLLAFTRHQETRPHKTDLNVLLAETHQILNQLISSDSQLELARTPDLWLVKVDPNQFEQLLVNMVVNARDAIPDGGEIRIETANKTLSESMTAQDPQHKMAPGDYVRLSIIDNGTGIPKNVQPHIFEPFFTTKEVGKGTGLGLSTCLGIVQQNKGTLTFTSQPGLGTTFNVYLPRYIPPKRPPRESAPGNEKISPTGTILLVEDIYIVRQMSTQALRQAGYTVLEAANGEDALQLVTEQNVTDLALLITDLSMPGMRGDELATALSNRQPGLKVLFISGHTESTLQRLEVLTTKHDILSKPFTPDQLLEKVKSLVKS
jgi:two-component system cell cycle sensor histidine kinase/response regulator CckA